MKKIFLIIVAIIMTMATIGLSIALYQKIRALETLEQRVGELSFKEGEVIENTILDGVGIVTASLTDWSYYEFSDENSFTPIPKGTLEEIFFKLYDTGKIDSLDGNLVKLKFSGRLIEESSILSKIYYKIGDFYIAAPEKQR